MENTQNLTSTAAMIEAMELYGTHPISQEKTFKTDLSEQELTDYLGELMGGLSDYLESSVLEDQSSAILSDFVNILALLRFVE
ncbi:hypothetical protein [Kiloniella sp.]|uniref:hypothetical protein n=1 Tax=Kiloniella sp. TaxID=1938587 RepID=UPI003B01A267